MAYYIIKCKLTGFVLDAQGGGKDGHKVIPYDRQDTINQTWYDDPTTGTIRLKEGNLCLAIKDNQLIVEKYKEGNPDQQWKRQEQYIKNGVDNKKAIDIYEDNKEKGAKIGAWTFHGKKNQCFEFIFVGGEAPVTGASIQQGGARKEFYIVAEKCGKVLDVAGGKKDAGTKVVIWDKHTPASPNQLWYLDPQGYIRSSLSDMTFASAKAGEYLRMQVASGDPRNQWTFHGRKVGCRAGECLDIRGGDNDNGSEVCSYEYKDQDNQHWLQQYV